MIRHYYIFIATSLLLGWSPHSLLAEVLVHETFAHGDVANRENGSPATWSVACFGGGACSNPTVEYAVSDGQLDAAFTDFAMFQLEAVDGVALTPGNNWSVRARYIKSRREGSNGNAVAGVGLNQFYHATSWTNPGSSDSGLALGQFFDTSSGGDIPDSLNVEQVIQIDVYPDHLDGFMWPASDPSAVSTTTWAPSGQVSASLPVFYGNYNTNAAFREVVVATVPLGVGGDFNRDEILDASDLDALAEQIRTESNDPRYNLTADVVVNQLDLDAWVHSIAKSEYGDANLDGEVGFEDFLALSAAFGGLGGWNEGDFDGDGRVQFPDFLILSKNFGKTSQAVQPVPEPSTSLMAVLIGVGATGWRRRVRRANR